MAMDPTGAKLLPHLEEHARRMKAHDERVIREQKAFESFDPKSLVDMSPEKLSAFQSSFLPSSPQFIVASHEWNNRLVAAHIKAIDAHSKSGSRAVWRAAIASALIGGFLSALGAFAVAQGTARIDSKAAKEQAHKRDNGASKETNEEGPIDGGQ
jgi:hypothetical protein